MGCCAHVVCIRWCLLFSSQVIASNGVFNSTATMVTEMTWLPPPTPMLLNKTNTSAVVMINVTSVQQIIRIFSVKVMCVVCECVVCGYVSVWGVCVMWVCECVGCVSVWGV